MKKMQPVFIVLLLSAVTLSCTKKKVQLIVNHGDKVQSIACSGEKNALLNEALYQFEEDIAKNYDPNDEVVLFAYNQFMSAGMSGTAPYYRIVSQEALDIRKILVLEGIIKDGGARSNLNYDHPLMECILENMEDQDLARTIKPLIESKTMDPKIFNSRLSAFERTAKSDRYTALYVALDSYYQRLTMTELPSQETNE